VFVFVFIVVLAYAFLLSFSLSLPMPFSLSFSLYLPQFSPPPAHQNYKKGPASSNSQKEGPRKPLRHFSGFFSRTLSLSSHSARKRVRGTYNASSPQLPESLHLLGDVGPAKADEFGNILLRVDEAGDFPSVSVCHVAPSGVCACGVHRFVVLADDDLGGGQ
jgi:hypothetical protein